jgi:hypothetical protein
MPNGFVGTKEEWDRVEAPLLEVNDVISEFAHSHGLSLDSNYHSMPNRRLMWDKGGITRVIEVSVNVEDMTIYVAYLAWQDRNNMRRGNIPKQISGLGLTELKRDLPGLLKEGYRVLESLSEGELEFWTDI